MMDDTPANYNQANRFHGNNDTGDMDGSQFRDEMADDGSEEDYGSEMEDALGLPGFEATGPDMAKVRRKKKKKKKRRRRRPDEYEDPSLREHLMAGAYGGIAKPKVKRQGVKYTTDLDTGLRDMAMTTVLPREDSAAKLDKPTLVHLVADNNLR